MRSVVLAVACLAACGRSHFERHDASTTTSSDSGSDDAAMNSSCPTWCVETSPTTANLTSVYARSPNDVWAVGEAGTVLRRTGGTWKVIPPMTSLRLAGIWLSPDTDEAFAVGENEIRLHYRGEVADAEFNATGYLAGVWGSDSQSVYAAGDGGKVFQWNGNSWLPISGVTGSLSAIDGSASTNVWITSTGNDVYQSTGGAFTPINIPAPDTDWFDVWVGGPSDVWLVGYEDMHWNGSSWTEYLAPTFNFVFDAIYSDGTTLWAGGPEGLGRFDGAELVKVSTPATQAIASIHGAGNEVWAVGDGGTILRFKP